MDILDARSALGAGVSSTKIGAMHILITGAAGMIGRKLTARLVRDGALNGTPLTRLTLADIIAPARPEFGETVETVAGDLTAPGAAEKLVAAKPDTIFHLAGVVSGEAESDFEKGYLVNLDGTRDLLEAIRKTKDYKPKVVFSSSIAVYGAPFPPEGIPDDFHLTPLTSYGAQKAASELLLADYHRREFLEGIGRSCRRSACALASRTRRRRDSSPESSASRSPAWRRCCRCRTECGIPMPARGPR
jgi:nucleoside-diphosphate-sugar epimerase